MAFSRSLVRATSTTKRVCVPALTVSSSSLTETSNVIFRPSTAVTRTLISIDIFRQAGAVLEGHFILTSGLRSPVFLQKARVFMHADKTEDFCRALAAMIAERVAGKIDYVVGPAVGGLIGLRDLTSSARPGDLGRAGGRRVSAAPFRDT